MNSLGMNVVFVATQVKINGKWETPFGYHELTDDEAYNWFKRAAPSIDDFKHFSRGLEVLERQLEFRFIVCNEENDEKYWPLQNYIPYKEKRIMAKLSIECTTL